MLDNENFRIAVINNIKNSSTLISETLRDYGYECISYNSADIAYKNIVNDNLDLIIINSDESTNIQKEIIQNIKSISTVNINVYKKDKNNNCTIPEVLNERIYLMNT